MPSPQPPNLNTTPVAPIPAPTPVAPDRLTLAGPCLEWLVHRQWCTRCRAVARLGDYHMLCRVGTTLYRTIGDAVETYAKALDRRPVETDIEFTDEQLHDLLAQALKLGHLRRDFGVKLDE